MALAALFTGTTLLLLSVLIWWNFNELLYGKQQSDSLGSTFLTIGKSVTNANMGKPRATVFSDEEVAALGRAPQVAAVGTITSNHFPVYAMVGGNLAFATDLPLESVPDSFLDQSPDDWKWQPGQRTLPIIISTQFLDIYNYVFAPSQGLPQLSASSVKSISITLKAGPQETGETFLAHVVGFSDRINAVLAPQSFLDYGNSKFGRPGIVPGPSQMIIKAKDPSDAHFVEYLTANNYTTNGQNLRWSKVRSIVEVVTLATGVLSLLLMGISILVFILFIELTVARARASLQLLIQIGYSPRLLARFLGRQFLPLVVVALCCSMGAALLAQVLVAGAVKAQGLLLPLLPGFQVWTAFFISLVILLLLLSVSIKRAIKE